MKNQRTEYPLPSHILSYSETTPKKRECSNGKSKTKIISSPQPSPKERECNNGKSKTNKRRTKDEQKTNKRRTKDEQKTKEVWH